SKTTNNLKMIGLAFQNHNDTNNCLPNNGGANDEDGLKAVNYGWHSPNIRNSGTWATQILPFMEQDPLFRNNVLPATAISDLPEFLTKNNNNLFWQVEI